MGLQVLECVYVLGAFFENATSPKAWQKKNTQSDKIKKCLSMSDYTMALPIFI